MAAVLTPLKTVPEVRIQGLRTERDKELAIQQLQRALNDVIHQYNELVTRLKDGTDI